ncbi:limonene-1,2-epoxide hydrolase [Rubricella aquisinus]|uniref:Limonene-1,2-epoxide hydrolase n=1 Tax=Rubricella aquisinus TaxID=2028108 RepID=A0A840WJA1_9RHOB|nr:nuclear transport factor 2 family protein [Rubricella aquisinus]MBB5514273.1 limonene-1,2-epoxide hydrolase [Rubricella aquisinus]
MDAKEVVRAFWTAMASNDFVAASQHLSPDFEGIWPQSGEVITGRANFAAINTAYPASGLWRFTLKRIIADGVEVVTDVDVTDGTVRATAVTFHSVAGGLIRRQVEYWPDPFPAPPWRADWVSIQP